MTNLSKRNSKAKLAAAAMLGVSVFATGAYAEKVTLKSADGTINLVGDFVEYKDNNYVIRTALGNLRVSDSRVRCEGAACPDLGNSVTADVTIAGSDTIGLGMMPLLMTGFASSMDADAELTATNAGETIAKLIGDGGFGDEIGSYKVSATSDDDAFASLLEGAATVGMSARRITPDEARALRADGAGNMVSPAQERIVAVDSVVVVTHPNNPVSEMTVEQLRGIFAGQITNWRQLGGPDKTINVIAREEGTASYDFFMTYLYGDEKPRGFLPNGIAADDQQVSNTVYLDPNAIGYVGYAFQRGAQAVSLVNECGIASSADSFSAKTEEYDLARRMYLYNRSDNLDDSSKAFLDFVISQEADGVIGKSGFIDLGIERRVQDFTDLRVQALGEAIAAYDVGFEGDVMQDMLDTMSNYDRLSTTFRFRTGSAKLDEKGRFDMERLISYLETAPAGTEVNFVGFTDSVGAFDANRRLSFGRADAVMREFQRAAGGRLDHIKLATNGYGEVAPSACNVTDRGRSINRRVEVWIAKS